MLKGIFLDSLIIEKLDKCNTNPKPNPYPNPNLNNNNFSIQKFHIIREKEIG